jgi:hypothetical protein
VLERVVLALDLDSLLLERRGPCRRGFIPAVADPSPVGGSLAGNESAISLSYVPFV